MILLLTFCLFAETAVVENGLNPKTPLTLTLTEDLRINPDDVSEADASWAGASQVVQVDKRGHMFVLDQRGSRLLEWNAAGKFVRQIGGPGQGPGEFSNLINFQIFPDQTALVFENIGAVTRVSHFDPGFVFRERQAMGGNLTQIPRNAVFSPNKRFMATTATTRLQKPAVEVTEFLLLEPWPEMKLRETLLHWETMALDPARVQDSNHWAEFLGERFGVLSKGKNAFAVFDSKGRTYTALADKYEITRWNSDLKKDLLIRKKYQPIALTGEEVDALTLPIRESLLTQLPPNLQALITVNLVRRAAQLAEFPNIKFPIAGLLLMEREDLLVVVHANNQHTGESIGDIFDTSGVYRGTFKHPGGGLSGMVFGNGHAYTIETNDDDEVDLVRYKYSVKAG